MSSKRSDKGSNFKSNDSNETNKSDETNVSNGTNETGMLQNTIRKDVIFMQQFTAACVAKLKLLKSYAEKETGGSHLKFVDAVNKYIMSLQDDNFDFQKILRKIYDVLKTESSSKMVKEKDPALFDMRNEDNVIITILPGINIRLVYPLLTEPDREYFWQYFHLMTLSTFNIFRLYNPKKVNSQPHVVDMINVIGQNLEQTGIMIDTKIFNPYLGLGQDDGKDYSLTELFAVTKELQTGEQLTLDAVLSTLGVGNLINEKELNAKLEALKDSDLDLATDQIVNILGAKNNAGARNVCDKLVKNIVHELKTQGIANVANVLKTVADKSKSEIHVNEMKQTIGFVQNFMDSGQEQMKNLKDENGNPIGQEMLNNLSRPLAMMKAMGMNPKKPL
jgi:hypothetical protein